MSVSVGAMIGAAAIGAAAQNAGSFIDWGVNSWLNQQQQEMALQRMASEQAFNAREANISRNWQEQMASTNYQRAIADMEKAGLNPASLVGSSPSGAMAPSAANASSSSSGVPGSRYSSAGMGSIMSSAINGMLAKDRDAAKFFADELRDNAKHAHFMEEIAERAAEERALESYKKALGHKSYKDNEEPYHDTLGPNAGFEML